MRNIFLAAAVALMPLMAVAQTDAGCEVANAFLGALLKSKPMPCAPAKPDPAPASTPLTFPPGGNSAHGAASRGSDTPGRIDVELAAPADEAAALYASALAAGKSEEDAQNYRSLLPTIKALHAAADVQSPLIFKQLRVGAEFQVKFDESQASGHNVAWVAGEPPTGTDRPRIKASIRDAWRCWTPQWAFTTTCFLTEAAESGTAFGKPLLYLELALSKPTFDYRPDRRQWQRATPPRITLISMHANGRDFMASARSYFDGLYKSPPKVTSTRPETGVTPTRASCAAVNAKRVNDLSTDDLKLRRSCANPTTGLFQAFELPVTSYAYSDSFNSVEIHDTTLMDGSTLGQVVMGNKKWIDAGARVPRQVEALRAEQTSRKAKSAQKDF